jgi:hypothetical protein
MKTKRGPILSVEEMSISSSDGQLIYKLPPEWIEMGFAHNRQLNLVPLLTVFGASGIQDGTTQNAGLVFITAATNFAWLPAFFTIRYTSGVCHEEGKLPVVINDLIGCDTTIEILSNMQNRNINNSESISQDGISQSASSAGTQIFEPRIQLLKEKRDKLKAEIKAEFNQKYYLSNI